MSAQVSQDVFVEDREIREKYVGKVDVLNKVKKFVVLPDGEHMTLDMVAEFYDVPVETIRSVTKNNKPELDQDGMNVVRLDVLREFKSKNDLKLQGGSLTIVPRRAVLRIGMLLRDSEVAKQVRNYLLEVESENKKQDVGSRVYWTSEMEKRFVQYASDEILAGKSLNNVLDDISNEFGIAKHKCQTKWYTKLRMQCSKDVLEKLQSNAYHSVDLNEQNHGFEPLNTLVLTEGIEDIKKLLGGVLEANKREIDWAAKCTELQAKLDAANEKNAVLEQNNQDLRKLVEKTNVSLAESKIAYERLHKRYKTLRGTVRIMEEDDEEIGLEVKGVTYKVGGGGMVESVS